MGHRTADWESSKCQNSAHYYGGTDTKFRDAARRSRPCQSQDVNDIFHPDSKSKNCNPLPPNMKTEPYREPTQAVIALVDWNSSWSKRK